MDYLNFSALNNKSQECLPLENPHFWTFIECLKRFVLTSYIKSFCVISFALSTVIMNICVIVYLNKHTKSKTVFDRIFIAHAFVDLLIGIFVVPFYLVYTLFGYWPLGKNLCLIYVALDYTLCHVGILHMVFICFTRLRSLLSPQSYKIEFFIYNTKLTIAILWLISSVLWLPGIYFQSLNYKIGDCYFTFNPIYIILQDIIAYLMPILAILIITFYILNRLHKSKHIHKHTTIHQKRSFLKYRQKSADSANSKDRLRPVIYQLNEISNESKPSSNRNYNFHMSQESSKGNNILFEDFLALFTSVKLNANAKLYVILTTFCVLWLPFCILWPIISICFECVPSWIYEISYWMGYGQSLINPILLLILTKPISDKKSELPYSYSLYSEKNLM